ncbi:MAG: IS3 family transposase [Caldimicrobium sp.]|nr:IS3 family transposase [Caldimicrobium sp.]
MSYLLERWSIPPSTFYYQKQREIRSKDREIGEEIRALALRYPFYGYKKVTFLLRARGYRVNHKKVLRLWREEGFNRCVFFKRRRQNRGKSKGFRGVMGSCKGELYAVDFIHDSLENGRRFRVFNVIDAYSRYVFPALVNFSLSGKDVAEHLEWIFREYGVLRVIRRDEGPEFKSKVFRRVIERWGIEEEVIPAGQPYNNGHIESFHRVLRRECLDREVFEDIVSARMRINGWIERYNRDRVHSSLGYVVPEDIWRLRSEDRDEVNNRGVQEGGPKNRP